MIVYAVSIIIIITITITSPKSLYGSGPSILSWCDVTCCFKSLSKALEHMVGGGV